MPKLADWLNDLLGRRNEPVHHDPVEGVAKPESPPELLPGNYYLFEVFIELTVNGVTYLGYPKQGIYNSSYTPPLLVWASPIKLACPGPSISRIPWIDDPQAGLAQRSIKSAGDMLGVRGSIGGAKYRFEKILQITTGQIVYSLFSDENHAPLAYAFSREIFDEPLTPQQ